MGWKYFKSWRSYLDLVTFILIWSTFAFLIVRFVVVSQTKGRYLKDTKEFTNFDNAFFSDELYGHTLAFVVFILFLKFVKLFRFNKKVLLMISTLKHSYMDLIQFFTAFIVFLFGFALLGFLLFGSDQESFSTAVNAFQTILNLSLGSFDYHTFESDHPILGRLYFLVYVLLAIFILVNMLIAIICDSFAAVGSERTENKYEIVDFLYSRFQRMLPASLTRRSVPMDLEDTVVEDSKSIGSSTKSRKRHKKESIDVTAQSRYEKANYVVDGMEQVLNRLMANMERIEKLVDWELDCVTFEECFLRCLDIKEGACEENYKEDGTATQRSFYFQAKWPNVLSQYNVGDTS